MRAALCLALLSGAAWAHGGSTRSAPPVPTTGPQVVPVPGRTDSPSGRRGGPTTPIAATGKPHDWRTWWAYHREIFLGQRMRGKPKSGLEKLPDKRDERTELRDDVILPILLRAVGDKHHRVRSAAAVALGKVGLPDADGALKNHLTVRQEGWWDVRSGAIFGLGLLGDPGNRKTLLSMSRDKRREARERSMSYVGLLIDESPKSGDELIYMLRHVAKSGAKSRGDATRFQDKEELRRMQAHLVGFLDPQRFPVDSVLWAKIRSSKSSPAVRGLAVTALGRHGDAANTSQVFRLLSRIKQKREVRRSAAIALGRLIQNDDEGRIRQLARIARRDRDPVVQHFALMSLAWIGGELAGRALADMAMDNTFGVVNDQLFLFLALGIVDTNRARGTLMAEYERAGNKDKRAVLALALGLARHDKAIPLTIKRLRKTSLAGGQGSDFLAFGALALGFHGRADGLDTVREVLRKYAHPRVREGATIGLVLLRGNRAAKELTEILLKSGSAAEANAAAAALGLLPEPPRPVIDALDRAWRQDSNRDGVRAAAVVALGAIGDLRTLPLSARLIRHYNYFIRCLALDEIATLL